MKILKGEIGEIWGKSKWSDLFAPVDNASLILFRIVFGGIMFWEVTRYFRYNWIYRYWVEPHFNFSYAPFNFKPLPETYMYGLWYVLGILAVFIIIGFLYRISTTLFFLLFSYTYLLEQGRYLNHFYLVILISFIMIFISAHRNFSVDSLIWKAKRSSLAPAWNLWLVRFLIGVPYFFGGIAKINPDWLQGYPLAIWLLGDTDFPIIGQYFSEHWMILFISYSGLLLDLLVVPFLLWKKTRWPVFIVIALFHLMNSRLFTIGIFPWFMMGATAMYFRPDWPRRLLNKLKLLKKVPEPDFRLQSFNTPSSRSQRRILVGVGLFVFLQLVLPFRHLLIPGNVHWTEEGHRYSWHMKLRSKSGYTRFYIQNQNTGERIEVKTESYLEPWQIDKMDGKPYMIWEFAQFLKKEYKLMGSDVAVYVDAIASLNGRTYQQIIAPNFDITKKPKPWLGSADWIIPLNTPLHQQR